MRICNKPGWGGNVGGWKIGDVITSTWELELDTEEVINGNDFVIGGGPNKPGEKFNEVVEELNFPTGDKWERPTEAEICECEVCCNLGLRGPRSCCTAVNI